MINVVLKLYEPFASLNPIMMQSAHRCARDGSVAARTGCWVQERLPLHPVSDEIPAARLAPLFS